MFRATAELSAIGSFIAFLISCIINSLVFSRWGQDFLQLATPTDVVMSGMRMLGTIAGPLLVAALAAIAGLLVIMSHDRLEALTDRFSKKSFTKNVFKIFETLALLGALGFWGLAIIYGFYHFVSLSDQINLALGLFMLIAVSVMILETVRGETKNLNSGCATVSFAVYGLLSLPAGILLVTAWFDSQIGRLSQSGFHEQWLEVRYEKADICGGGSRLMWSGSQSELVECGGDGKRMLVLRNMENVTYQPKAMSNR